MNNNNEQYLHVILYANVGNINLETKYFLIIFALLFLLQTPLIIINPTANAIG